MIKRLIKITCIAVFIITALLGAGKPHSIAKDLSNSRTSAPLYYPLQQGNTPTPIKEFSGIHLGNKTRDFASDWTNEELSRIDPNLGGVWPDSVVVLSDQVYDIDRYDENHPDPLLQCRIREARIRLPVIYDYLKRAGQSGVKVVIRIMPSPGNFKDWDKPPEDPAYRQDHILLPEFPAGGNYCNPVLYRNPIDIAEEMIQIHALNVNNGFPEYGFEPANEPNIEWYSSSSIPEHFKDEAWDSMDIYFSNVYNKLQILPGGSGVRLLTPPMAQGVYAEGIDWQQPLNDEGQCVRRELIVSAEIGYERMRNTHETYSHGISWHNYWDIGREIYNSCENGGQHVSWYFPQWMKDSIRNNSKQVIITEADLNSPIQGGNVNDKNEDPFETADSIRHFFHSEWSFGGNLSPTNYGVRPSIALWLLNDNINDAKLDHNWHEAYFDDGTTYIEYEWFPEWYLKPEEWPLTRLFLPNITNR